MSHGAGREMEFVAKPIQAAFARSATGATRAGGADPRGCFSFVFGRERPCAFRFAIRLFHGNFWVESGLTSKPIQRRVALAVKAFSICSSPRIPSCHSAFHLNGFAFLCRSRIWASS